MSARVDGSGDRMMLARQHAIYDAKSAYRSETGGLLDALRSLTVDQGA